jgi:hypothetical protein
MTGQVTAPRVPKFAIVRVSTFDVASLVGAAAAVEEFQRLHASQPGYAGTITVDLGSGRRLAVNLWESEEDADAARENLRSAIDALLGDVMTDSALIGTGPVLRTDIRAYAPPTQVHEEQR